MTSPKDTGSQQPAPSAASEKAALLIEQASEKIARKDLPSACALLEQACLLQPRSIDLLCSTAMTWLQAGDPRRSEEFLAKAHRFAPNNTDILHNLAIVRSTLGKFEEASECFHKLILLAPMEAAAYNDLAVLEEETGNLAGALDTFQRGIRLKSAGKKIFMNFMDFSLRHPEMSKVSDIRAFYVGRWGEDQHLHDWENLCDSQSQTSTPVSSATTNPVKKAKIAFVATHRSFVDPIIEHAKKSHEVKVIEQGNENELRALMEWADLTWFEWCDQNVIAATRLPKTSKIICRLHSYEAFTDMPRHVDWKKVDHLVLVSDAVKDLLTYNVPIPTPTTVIHNGLDVEKFMIPKNKKSGKKICSIGYINYKKNPALLLYCFKAIHDYDPGYTFHIAGEHQDPRIQVYFAHLLPKLNIPVTFDGWVDDIPAYLQDKDFVISTSLFESFHYSIAEGMASGVLPLIHDWLGADRLYPNQYLFTTPEDCVRLVASLEKKDRRAEGEACRKFISERYDARKQLSKIGTLITKVLKGENCEGING